MSLKNLIQTMFSEITNNMFDHHETDLYILYDENVYQWLMRHYDHPQNIVVFTSDVEGQEWCGKKVIEVPFMWEDTDA